VALSECAPFLGLTVAQPECRGTDVSQHLFAPAHHDRHLGMGRGEDLPGLATIAGGAAIERLLDPGVSDPAALGDGGGEVGMAAAPVPIGCDVDLEEIGNVARLGAEAAQLAGLDGVGEVVGGEFPVPGGNRGCFYFFEAFPGRFGAFFWFGIKLLWGNSLILRNREIGGTEQGIGFAGTGNFRRSIAGCAAGVRRRLTVGQAEDGV
jgi:hypothetical protein